MGGKQKIHAGVRRRVALNFNRLLDKHDLSKRELARRSGVPASVVALLAKGETGARIDTLARLAETWEVDVSEFFRVRGAS